MSQTMYEQAILDAQSLKKMAEETAKNEIIKAMSPQIKNLIENEVFSSNEENTLKEVERRALVLETFSTSSLDPYDGRKGDDADEDDENKQPLLLDDEGDDNVSETNLRALAKLVHLSSVHTQKELNESINSIRKRLARMSILAESVDPSSLDHELRVVFLKKLNSIIRETLQIRSEAILIKESGDVQVYNKVEKTIQEIKRMARRLNKGVFSKLFEDSELNELDATLVLAPADEDEEAEVDSLLADLDVELEIEAVGGEEDDEEEEDEDDLDLEDEDEAGELELDLGEGDHDDMDEVYEIDESALRRALRALTEEAADEADQFGGGEVEGDVIVDLDEEDLLHALDDELGDAPRPTVESRRASRRSHRKTNESRRSRKVRKNLQEARTNRVLKSKLRQATGAVNQLQGQLTEMNLFNAKLLYANKLMQNKNLNTRQQRTVVEALDSASTLREAKLLYKSLSAGITKGKTIRESGSRVRGSSSKSTLPSGTKSLNEGAGQTDRWATLAGIVSGKK